MIDFDHYIIAIKRTKKFSLFKAFEYYEEVKKIHLQEIKKGIRQKGDFHIFHTVEFHILIGVLGIWWTPFFYIFIGMVFHSLLDLFDALRKDVFYRREYFFFKWLRDIFR